MPTALLSVYDKTGIVEFAAGLHAAGWTIVSSGGTAAAIAAAGVPVTDVAELTGVPAILDHRVVTLHPKVHGGLLADPTKPDHQADMAEYGIEPIDLVVVNLYPFTSDPSIELIDIGGPAMVRAAAKNHAHVGVVVDPADYEPVLDEIRADGALTPATRRRLARTRSPTPPHTTRRSSPGSTSRRTTTDATRPAAVDAPRRSNAPSRCATARTRTSRVPATAGGRRELVGRDDPARRQGAQLPQPVRHRGRVAAGADASTSRRA